MASLCKSHNIIIPLLPSNTYTSDVWAIGVITYFLLCGYTPFDRDSNLEEMQAILVADYSFTPLEYWRGVSQTARDFIRRCLTVDPAKRMTAHEALSHPWIADMSTSAEGEEDLLPTVKKNFNARRTLHAAIDTIRAINQLRAGGAAGMMEGVVKGNEARRAAQANVPQPAEEGPEPMEVDSGRVDSGRVDSRGNGHGQTEEMIREQERRIRETQQGMWERR
jgi:serine/threonine protein kinase